MSFDQWIKQQDEFGELSPHEINLMRSAWNGALKQIAESTEIHNTIGDIKDEVNYLKE